MTEKNGFAKFFVALLMPFLLILIGAGLAALGITMGWTILFWAGLIVAAIGLLWGAILMLFHGPVDL